MNHPFQLFAVIFLVLGLAACGGSDDNEAGGASSAALSDQARFDSDIRNNGCELLTAAMVSATFDVPADDLKPMKIMGCRYGWENDSQTIETGIAMIRAHKSEQSAAQWFGNATRSRTAEEMNAQMEEVAQRMESSEALDTKAKKAMAQGILSGAGSKAVNFENVAGVGDEARVNDGGTVYVRVNNLTFMVTAYKGPEAPPLDLQGVDLKQMAAVAGESARQWAIKTAPQRKKDGAQLARAIVAEL